MGLTATFDGTEYVLSVESAGNIQAGVKQCQDGGPDSIFLSIFYDGIFGLDFISLAGGNGLKRVNRSTRIVEKARE